MATLRRAVPADAPSLARLRGLMHTDMGHDARAPGLLEATQAALARRLAEPDRFVAFVVEVDGAVVSGGAVHVEEHLPSPTQLDGRRGHVSSMSTDPAHRRAGHARAVLRALLAWTDDRGIARVDLRATADGRALYEAHGFTVLGGATMARTAPGVRPGLGTEVGSADLDLEVPTGDARP